jgi:chromosome segregation ATPase
MDIEEILERDSALKALEHAEARIAELERENEELKRERDRCSESCYYAELDRAEFSKENKALEEENKALRQELRDFSHTLIQANGRIRVLEESLSGGVLKVRDEPLQNCG